jgi:cell division protein FtsI (penicillin-binding protein 3)
MVNCTNTEVSKRGDIVDTNGKILALSVKKYTVFIDPNQISNFSKVKTILNKNGINITKRHLSKFGKTSYIPIANNIDSRVIKKLRQNKLNGVGFHSKYIRQYPSGKLFANIIGITDYDGNGLSGIEYICNQYLHGKLINFNMIRDGRGNIIYIDKNIRKSKIQGNNVQLYIDSTIQFIVTQELQRAMDKSKAKKAICIIQNPKTGAILAMVSLPSFDPNKKLYNINLLRNPAISDVYEPGSTFKIVPVSTALDTGIVNLADNFFLENDHYNLDGHIIKDNHKKINRFISLSEAIEYSSNIVVSKIAQKIGVNTLYKYIKKFGFHSLTGIKLPGEEKGLLRNVNKITTLSLGTIAFGQGIGVTAIQLLTAFSTIANDGIMMQPLLIKTISNKVIKKQAVRRVISYQSAKIMQRILKNAVEFGTGHSGKIAGYSMGGKTGTAQKIDPSTKRYSKTAYTASFCGMIPATQPKIVILIIIDEPCGNYYASSVVSPIFARIANKVLQYLEIEKDE